MTAREGLPAGWEVAKDAASGREYYYNAASRETRWTKPEPEQSCPPQSRGRLVETESREVAFESGRCNNKLKCIIIAGICLLGVGGGVGVFIAVKGVHGGIISGTTITTTTTTEFRPAFGHPPNCKAGELPSQVTHFNGSFCSPDCTSNAACPAAPVGTTATPTCSLKWPNGTKQCGLDCSASNGVICPEGAVCQAPEGLQPLCVYPFYYEDPYYGEDHKCQTGGWGEVAKGITGIDDSIVCQPVCKNNECPTYVQPGVTAVPKCLLHDTQKHDYCALDCSNGKSCPTGARCASANSYNWCVYPVHNSNTSSLGFHDVRNDPHHAITTPRALPHADGESSKISRDMESWQLSISV